MKRKAPYKEYISRKRVAQASAATLGYIVGDIPGAVTGAALTETFFPKEIKLAMPRSAINNQAKRASMNRYGSDKIKSIRGKNRKVKVSNKLKEKIKKVIEEKKAPGYYVKTTEGSIGSCINNTISPYYTDIGPITNAITVVPMFSNIGGLGGQQVCWWHSLLPYGDLSTKIPTGWDMSYFTPAKFMDAAAILWNKKAMAQNALLSTGNFYTYTSETGVPQNTYRSNLYIKNSWVTFEFKNNSQRTITLLIRHCVPKLKFVDDNPLAIYTSAILDDSNASGNFNGPLVPYSGNVTESYAKYLNDIDVPWSFVDGFSKTWKYETIKIIIAPGETCKHSIQGPKNMNLNYNDIMKSGSQQFYSYFKKTSCSVVIGVLPDLVFAESIGEGQPANYTGRWVDFSANTDKTIRNPISVEIKEHFDMGMPELTGFVEDPGTKQTQMLNLRSKKYASYKFQNNLIEESATIKRYDEEQPATAINLG